MMAFHSLVPYVKVCRRWYQKIVLQPLVMCSQLLQKRARESYVQQRKIYREYIVRDPGDNPMEGVVE